MRLATRLWCALLLGPAAARGQAPPAPPAAQAVRIEHQEWTKDVDGDAPIRTIEVRNDYGDVRVRLNGARRLEALAVIQRLGPGPERVGFSVERRGSVVALVAALAPGRVQDADPDPPKAASDRLDLTLFVPEGVALDVRTLRGMVEARGLKSDVCARALAGAVTVSTSGAVSARTASGDIAVTLDPVGGTAPLVFETQSGAVSLRVPASSSLTIQVEGGGPVASDFALAASGSGRAARHAGKIGGGGRPVFVFSATGAVEIRAAD